MLNEVTSPRTPMTIRFFAEADLFASGAPGPGVTAATATTAATAARIGSAANAGDARPRVVRRDDGAPTSIPWVIGTRPHQTGLVRIVARRDAFPQGRAPCGPSRSRGTIG